MKSANKLHKLIFKLFKKQMIQLAYTPKPSPVKLDFVFFDKEGVRWFEAKDMPILRKLYLIEAVSKIWNGITDNEMNKSIEAIYLALNERVDNKMRPNIARIGFICQKLLSRQGYAINIDAIYEMAAMYYIRDGEAPEYVDHNIMQSKVSALKELDITDFFFSQRLDILFPFLQDYEGTIKEVAEEAKIQADAFIKTLELWQTK